MLLTALYLTTMSWWISVPWACCGGFLSDGCGLRPAWLPSGAGGSGRVFQDTHNCSREARARGASGPIRLWRRGILFVGVEFPSSSIVNRWRLWIPVSCSCSMQFCTNKRSHSEVFLLYSKVKIFYFPHLSDRIQYRFLKSNLLPYSL